MERYLGEAQQARSAAGNSINTSSSYRELAASAAKPTLDSMSCRAEECIKHLDGMISRTNGIAHRTMGLGNEGAGKHPASAAPMGQVNALNNGLAEIQMRLNVLDELIGMLEML